MRPWNFSSQRASSQIFNWGVLVLGVIGTVFATSMVLSSVIADAVF
jgi:hypothetical protein